MKLFKPIDSIEICLLKERLLSNFLNVRFHRNMFIKEKVTVKLFKNKDSIEIGLLKKGYCETF